MDSGSFKADEIVGNLEHDRRPRKRPQPFEHGFLRALSPWLGIPIDQVPKKIPLIMIGGCSGLVAPYIGVFVRQKSDKVPDGKKHFSIGVAQTRDLKPEEIGTMTHVELTEQAVKEAMEQAGITEIADVHCVQTKNPGLTPAKIADADRRGAASRTLTSRWLTREYVRHGRLLALGEVPREKVTKIRFAGTSASTTQYRIHLNEASAPIAPFVMGNSTLRSAIPSSGTASLKRSRILSVLEALRNAGMELSGLRPRTAVKIDHEFVKSNMTALQFAGRRHVLNTDFWLCWLLKKRSSRVGDVSRRSMMQFPRRRAPGTATAAGAVLVKQ